MASPVGTLHTDGWRVDIRREDRQIDVMLQLYAGGELVEEHRLNSFVANPGAADSYMAEAGRFARMAQAVCRFLNTGGDIRDVFMVFNVLQGIGIDAAIGLELVGTQAEETHVAIFRKPDGSFLRIIEDEVTEHLTQSDLLQIVEEEDFLGDDIDGQ